MRARVLVRMLSIVLLGLFSSSAHFESFLERWGYLAVGLGTFFEGEAVLIAAGALAHRGIIALPWVMTAAFVGSVIGDQLWFQLGRRYGRRFIERRPDLEERIAWVRDWTERGGALFVFGFRFLYGFRTITPLLLGANHYPPSRFALYNALGGATWAVLVGLLGWGFGASVEALFRRAGRVEELLLGALVLAGAIALVSRNRVQKHGGPHEPRPSPSVR